MTQTAPKDVIKWVEATTKSALHAEEGVHHGPDDVDVTGITVCWKASPGAIAEAGARGDGLLRGHESLHYPYYFDFDPDRTPGWSQWGINQRRTAALDMHGQTYLRLHASIDRLCVAADMAKWLQLGEPADDGKDSWTYDIPPCRLRELVAKVKRISGMPAVRVAAPKGLDHKVTRLGLLVGGAGLCPNGTAFEPGVRSGVDVFVAGETDNYGFRYAAECGAALIETSHEVCENPGLRHFSQMVAERFPDLRVTFYENRPPYQVL